MTPDPYRPRSVNSWSHEDVASWLKEQGLHRAAHSFNLLQVDGAQLISACAARKRDELPLQPLSDEEVNAIIARAAILEKMENLVGRGANGGNGRRSPDSSTVLGEVSGEENSGAVFINMDDYQMSVSAPRTGISNGIRPGVGDASNHCVSPLGDRGTRYFTGEDHFQKVNLNSTAQFNDLTNYPLPPASPSSSTQSGTNSTAEVYRADLIRVGAAVAYIFGALICTAVSIAVAHGRVPDTAPLPDLFLDFVPRVTWSLGVVEIFINCLLFTSLGIVVFHKHRLIIFRRACVIIGTAYYLRCLTIMLTSLPKPGDHLSCVPEHADTMWARTRIALRMLTSGGYSAHAPKDVVPCGDYLYSGHTITLTAFTMLIVEYTPPRLRLIHILAWALTFSGMFLILLGHDHYTVDVILGFYITNRLHANYHALIAAGGGGSGMFGGASGRSRLWFPVFSFMEINTEGPLPNQYDARAPFFRPLARLVRKMTIGRMAGGGPPVYSSLPTTSSEAAGALVGKSIL